MINYQDDEIFMFPVPKSRLRDVYALLAEPTTDSATVVAEEAVEVPDQGSLTLAMISKLQVELEIPAIQSLLTRLAQQAPQPLAFKEAVQAAGVGSNNLRAQLGSLTKITKRLFGYPIWPMQVRYAAGGEAIYSMDPKIAEWWLASNSEDEC